MDINELKALGFNSEDDAEATEWALGIRFSGFTPEDRRTWRLQELCLKQYALTPSYERVARRAGVTVGEVKAWERVSYWPLDDSERTRNNWRPVPEIHRTNQRAIYPLSLDGRGLRLG